MSFPDHLLKGYRSFLQEHYSLKRDCYQKLAHEGQSPSTMVIGCCDSRVAPEHIFNTEPGKLFVLRNVGNLVPPYAPDGECHGTSAAVEYAVNSLHVSYIIIMGHALCGGIRFVLDSTRSFSESGDFIQQWMNFLAPVAKVVSQNTLMSMRDKERTLEQISIRFSLANLRTFPFVRSMETQGRLILCGAWFDILTGELWVLNPSLGDFERLDP